MHLLSNLFAQNSEANLCYYNFETTTIQGHKYSGILNDSGFILLKNDNDTLLKSQEIYFSLKFDDFNKDGFNDLFLDRGGNTPERYDLLLYVPVAKKFKQVINFDKFPNPINIASTKYYYSYHKNGCADLDWVSDLFFINNFKAIRVGKIDGVGCGTANTPTAIYIYKMNSEKRKLLKALPINTIEKFNDHKWGFIKNYWLKNYKKFVK